VVATPGRGNRDTEAQATRHARNYEPIGIAVFAGRKEPPVRTPHVQEVVFREVGVTVEVWPIGIVDLEWIFQVEEIGVKPLPPPRHVVQRNTWKRRY
jgi:hypothetical protein